MIYKSNLIKLVGLVFLLIFIQSCRWDRNSGEDEITLDEVKYDPTPYNFEEPYGFPILEMPEDNPMTIKGVALGRRLYYDPILDKNQTRSCSRCHFQEKSFTTDGEVLPHINIAWGKSFLWDGKVEGTLEDIMLFEVDEFFETDLSNLNGNEEYQKLFKEAFDVKTITSKEISYALAQFFRILVSANSKIDKFYQMEYTLSPLELLGSQIFYSEKGDCFHCHTGMQFSDNDFHNNGLDQTFTRLGRGEVTGNSLDNGKFKTPTLRNIVFTGPYMHDGRYETLEEVIDFYSEGIQLSETIDPLMKKANQGGIQLNKDEKAALLAFIKCMTDSSYTTNPELANPF